MKGILFALFTTLLSVGCSEDAREEAVQVDTQDESVATFGDKFTIPDLDLTMIWVEPGTFMMGSPETEKSRTGNETQHEVTLTNGFYLGKYELTQAQWEKVMGSDPSRFKGADRPVENVSWNDVVAFCKNLTEMEKKVGRVPKGMAYQLPTEAQWEYACRAGTTTKYSWGDSINASNANYDENLDETTPVGKYPANPWGFHDMHGNVWEWCVDRYGTYPTGLVTDPLDAASGLTRVTRGGSLRHVGSLLRSAKRRTDAPRSRIDVLGFRVSFQKQK
jgi:formylglycine-generating enzyme required for sulfatase activity